LHLRPRPKEQLSEKKKTVPLLERYGFLILGVSAEGRLMRLEHDYCNLLEIIQVNNITSHIEEANDRIATIVGDCLYYTNGIGVNLEDVVEHCEGRFENAYSQVRFISVAIVLNSEG
jgi:hypothetical protein